MRQKFFLLLIISVGTLFAQYNFNFVCTSDTFQTGTDYFVYYFRLTNTGSQPDSYAFNCRVVDSVPGWFEIYCAGGQCAEPGIILYDYLTPGAVDTGIDISVYTATGVWGTEIINLKVWSLHNPSLKDSINVYAAMEQVTHEHKSIDPFFQFQIKPNPFNKYLSIKCRIPINHIIALTEYKKLYMEQDPKIVIFDITGKVIKTLNLESCNKNQVLTLVWYGDDDFNKSVPQGVYFIEFSDGKNKIQRKVVKVK